MKKKTSFAILLTMIMALVVSSMAMAVPAPDVVVTITPYSADVDGQRIEVPQGSTQLLTATAVLGSGNFTFVSDLWTNATRQSGPLAGDTSGSQFVSTALFNSAGYAVGDKVTVTYQITVTRGSSEQQYESDSDYAYIEIIEGTITVEVTPKAAPAVAAAILKYNGVSPLMVVGQGRNREQVNMIAAVAHHMGPQTYFNGVPKSVWVMGEEVGNPLYWQEVLNFLNSEFGLSLVMPPTMD
jgi:hypothetical protein